MPTVPGLVNSCTTPHPELRTSQQLRLPPSREDAWHLAPQAATPRAKASTLLCWGDPLRPAGQMEAAGKGAITVVKEATLLKKDAEDARPVLLATG